MDTLQISEILANILIRRNSNVEDANLLLNDPIGLIEDPKNNSTTI